LTIVAPSAAPAGGRMAAERVTCCHMATRVRTARRLPGLLSHWEPLKGIVMVTIPQWKPGPGGMGGPYPSLSVTMLQTGAKLAWS